MSTVIAQELVRRNDMECKPFHLAHCVLVLSPKRASELNGFLDFESVVAFLLGIDDFNSIHKEVISTVLACWLRKSRHEDIAFLLVNILNCGHLYIPPMDTFKDLMSALSQKGHGAYARMFVDKISTRLQCQLMTAYQDHNAFNDLVYLLQSLCTHPSNGEAVAQIIGMFLLFLSC